MPITTATSPQAYRCWLVLEKPAGCLAWKPLGFWVRSGTWNKQCPEGRAEGFGTLTWQSFTRDWYKGKGTMLAGKPTGDWVFRNQDGGRYEGFFDDGLRQGLWTFDGGRSKMWSKRNYLDDKEHGEQSHGQGRLVHSVGLLWNTESSSRSLQAEKLGRQ